MSNEGSVDLRDLQRMLRCGCFFTGLWRLLFGGVIGVCLYALLFAMVKTAGEPPSAANRQDG